MPEINNISNKEISPQPEIISSNIKATSEQNAPSVMKIQFSKRDKDPFIYYRAKGKQMKGREMYQLTTNEHAKTAAVTWTKPLRRSDIEIKCLSYEDAELLQKDLKAVTTLNERLNFFKKSTRLQKFVLLNIS